MGARGAQVQSGTTDPKMRLPYPSTATKSGPPGPDGRTAEFDEGTC
jgi:hypothetical protein